MSNMGPNNKPVGVTKEVENNHATNPSNGQHKSDMQVGTSSKTERAFINYDLKVNKKSGNIEQVDVEEEIIDVDLTESSSSFDSDGAAFDDFEDLEFYDDVFSGFPFDGCNELLQERKKKLSASWKKHVEPLKWRCKWVELQIKKFELQAQNYESEIAELENVNSEYPPFSAVMKRKNRRRVEDTEDISSYMSQHNMFSHFENKNSAADAGGTDGNLGNQENPSNGTTGNVVKEGSISCEFKEMGNFLGKFLWEIGAKQWKLREMRTRAQRVIDENASRFSPDGNLSLLISCNNSVTSSAINPPSPKDEIVPVAPSISNEIVRDGGDTDMIDVAVPESENPPAIGGSSRKPTGTILMYNRRSKMNRNKSKEVSVVSSSKPQEDHQASTSNDPSCQVPEPSPPKMISLSKMMANTIGSTSFKRKRAVRKAGSGKWNR